MLAINLYYLNFFGRCTLRPRDVFGGDGADGSSTGAAAAAPPPERFWRLLFIGGAREALRLPFWDNCRALAAVRSCWRRSRLAAFSAFSFSLTFSLYTLLLLLLFLEYLISSPIFLHPSYSKLFFKFPSFHLNPSSTCFANLSR
jgi:hypothetical protein